MRTERLNELAILNKLMLGPWQPETKTVPARGTTYLSLACLWSQEPGAAGQRGSNQLHQLPASLAPHPQGESLFAEPQMPPGFLWPPLVQRECGSLFCLFQELDKEGPGLFLGDWPDLCARIKRHKQYGLTVSSSRPSECENSCSGAGSYMSVGAFSRASRKSVIS